MDNEDPPALKRPRTREDFYLFCTYVLEHENYIRQMEEEPRQSTSPMDSAGLVSDSNLSSGQEDSNKPTDEDTGQYNNYVDSESYDLVTCYCNKPFAGRPMIECSNCLTWVHLSCAKIRKKHIPEVFYCAICKSSGNNLLNIGDGINGNSIGRGGSGSNSPSNVSTNSTTISTTQFVPRTPPSPTQSAIAVISPNTQTPNPPITTQKSHRNHLKNGKTSSPITSKAYHKNTEQSPISPTIGRTTEGNNGLTRVRGTNAHGQFSHVKLSPIGGKSFKQNNINRINMSHQKSTTPTNSSGGGYKRTPHS